MSNELGSETQIPVVQQTIMDLEIKENQTLERGAGVTVIDKEMVKEDEIQEKGLMESVKEVRFQVQDTKFVDAQIGAQIGNGTGSVCLGEKSAENIREDVVIQKKCSKRKFTETNLKKNVLSMLAEAKNVCEKKSDGSKRKYSRSEMEALRFENSDQQRQIWREIYTGLGPIVAKELNRLAEDKQKGNVVSDQQQQRQQKQQKHPQKPHQHRGHQQAGVNIESASVLDCSQNLELNMDEYSLGGEYPDDEYDSIKKPAFYVEGDPDFDSGPPEDGLEYLRRVRYEAAKIPDWKVAKLDTTMVIKEQTPYMPKIPDIAKCPLHLQPSKEWEDAFLADFSELRQALPHLEGSMTFQPMSVADVDDASRGSRDPTVSVILGMDHVARVSMVKRCIDSFQTKSSLSRNDCAWLFALLVAVDIPLDGDTTASVRCLLRKCASLRAGNLEASEDDDEVVMLNMLVTICGRFFGQLD
ncbi:hypothetical protein MKW94_004070 [Papaver nudicaule]|uniref:Gem-associated protein 2 n=1 Tax=Papaver nudicaule TaxID=74823 RepID=A0AA41VJ78_PAPNU|nr:hypothetical protein [Papaver nudicaule]